MTQEQENIHYRTGGKLTHCGVECLPDGKDIERIVIERIEFKEKEDIGGRTETGVWVAHFAPNPYTTLPFVLNATNRKRLVKKFPECDGYPARLHNVAVRLTKERCRDVQDGGTTWGLRISQIDAAPEPTSQKKVISEDKVDAAIQWARENGKTLEDMKSIYEMSDTVLQAMTDALEDLP